jgi:tetratricopeptide (TPR) repeat protein
MTPDSFLADLAAVYAGDGSEASFGSGRLIAPGLVLTAGHVVDFPGRDAPLRKGWNICLVKERTPAGGWSNQAHEAELVWRGAGELDMALLRLTGAAIGPKIQPVFAFLDSTAPIEAVDAAGFPDARRGEAGDIVDYRLSGRLRVASAQKPYAWSVPSADKPDDAHGWKGMSGAAVCKLIRAECLHIFGVVKQVPANFQGGQLDVARLSAAFADPAFRAELRRSLHCAPALLQWRDPASTPPATALLRSTVPSLGKLRFVGRAELFDAIEAGLGDPGGEAVVVLRGPAGVGKTELAQEFARRHRHSYPGGTFVIDGGTDKSLMIGLARLGRTVLGLDVADDMTLHGQAQRVLPVLGAAPSLLIYDNVCSEDAVRPWLPSSGTACHVLMTTLLNRWDTRWNVIPVEPLSPAESLELVSDIAGWDLADRYGAQLSRIADGLPVQLVPASATLAREAHRGDDGAAPQALLTRQTEGSFAGVYHLLGPQAQLLLHAASRMNPRRIPVSELQDHLAVALGWTTAAFRAQLTACCDLHVLQGAGELRMHQLFATFLRDSEAAHDIRPALAPVIRAQAARLVRIASQVAETPNRADLAALMTAYQSDVDRWEEAGAAVSIADGETIGRALLETGQFAAAQPWFERAAAAAQPDGTGHSDHEILGSRLHLVGCCLASQGRFAAAQTWLERAVAAKEQGDISGRVDHASLGGSLQQVGNCLSSQSKFAAAQPWFERAVAAKEQGDIQGRINHASLGRSLHQVGFCLANQGQLATAQPWFERAVAAADRGDLNGRVDHATLGRSLHQVGDCLSGRGQFAEARPWFERAVAAAARGDIHGRVDHASLGRSLHQVGYCLASQGQFALAQPWFERAVAAAERGDIHGRIDRASLGISVHQVGCCLARQGQIEAAQQWFERAGTQQVKEEALLS